MAIKDAFIAELKYEAALTKKVLERVPFDQKDWKPHEKSMSIGRLATHTAETIHWISDIFGAEEFDFAARPFKPHTAASQEELLGLFQQNLDKAIAVLAVATDEDFAKTWTVKRGEQVLYNLPRKIAVRNLAFSHQFHHRGQLTVYLRLLNIPVPGIYGPSADER